MPTIRTFYIWDIEFRDEMQETTALGLPDLVELSDEEFERVLCLNVQECIELDNRITILRTR